METRGEFAAGIGRQMTTRVNGPGFTWMTSKKGRPFNSLVCSDQSELIMLDLLDANSAQGGMIGHRATSASVVVAGRGAGGSWRCCTFRLYGRSSAFVRDM